MSPDIFKAYDIRGKVGSELTRDVAKRVGMAMASWLPNVGTIAVGRDMRPDSEDLANGLIEGLIAQGRDVLDIGQVTSDMIYFAVGHFNLAGGVMVTASHNPGEYNGIKLCREEARPIGIETGLANIRDMAITNEFGNDMPAGVVTKKDIVQDWIHHVLSFISVGSWASYKVAIDAGNGMAGAIVPALEGHTPLQIVPMFFELDGTFPNHIANPLIPENLVALQERVKVENLDFGIAFDGDGDRAVLVDETGEPLTGTVMTAMLADYFLKKTPHATILYNAICGRIVPEAIEADGGKGIRTKVGHSYIKADMRTYDAIFAGEHSGHYYFKDNFYADSGLIAAMIAVQVLSESGKKLSELAAEYRKYAALPEVNFEVKDAKAVVERLQKAFSDGTIDTLDGLTVNYPDGWFNVRASNTEPLVRLNVEATDKNKLDELVAKIIPILEG